VTTTYHGLVHNGQIKLDHEQKLPEGSEVLVMLVPDFSEERGITGEELLNSGLVGLWADREDIADSAAFAVELRRRSEQRD